MTSVLPLAACFVVITLVVLVPLVVRAFKTVVISTEQGVEIKRSEHPKYFWLYFIVYSMYVALGFGGGITVGLLNI